MTLSKVEVFEKAWLVNVRIQDGAWMKCIIKAVSIDTHVISNELIKNNFGREQNYRLEKVDVYNYNFLNIFY